jgi:hypothetical protein
MKRFVTVALVSALATPLATPWILGSFTALAASAAFAQEGGAGAKTGCAAFTWDVSHELEVLAQPAQTITAARDAKRPVRIELERHYTLKLAPQSEVKYAAKVGKTALDDGAHGGLATVHVTQPGRYRISITSGHWLDLLDGRNLVVSRDFQGQRGCEKAHKIVEFELAGNRDFVLQLSGAPDGTVGVAVTQVKTAS